MACRRSDLLDHWLSHGTITQREFEAGKRFERVFDTSEIDGLAALDLLRPRVGGSYRGEPAAQHLIDAREELKALRAGLGGLDFALVCRVLGRGETIAREGEKESERRYLTRRLRDALRQLSVRPGTWAGELQGTG